MHSSRKAQSHDGIGGLEAENSGSYRDRARLNMKLAEESTTIATRSVHLRAAARWMRLADAAALRERSA